MRMTFKEYILLENAIADIKAKFIKQKPILTGRIEQAFKKYMDMRNNNRIQPEHKDITKYAKDCDAFLQMVDSYSTDNAITNTFNQAQSYIHKYTVALNDEYRIILATGPNMCQVIGKMINARFWCVTWPDNVKWWDYELSNQNRRLYIIVHRKYNPHKMSQIKAGAAIIVDNETNKIVDIRDVYDNVKGFKWLKEFGAPIEDIKTIKLPSDWDII